MQRPYRPLSPSSMEHATRIANAKVQEWLTRASKLTEDPDKAQRLAAHRCKACYYGGARIGGAAVTSQPCGCCGKEQTYSSTATDALCLSCAEQHHLCKQCGGDLEMDKGRKEWPEAK